MYTININENENRNVISHTEVVEFHAQKINNKATKIQKRCFSISAHRIRICSITTDIYIIIFNKTKKKLAIHRRIIIFFFLFWYFICIFDTIIAIDNTSLSLSLISNALINITRYFNCLLRIE